MSEVKRWLRVERDPSVKNNITISGARIILMPDNIVLPGLRALDCAVEQGSLFIATCKFIGVDWDLECGDRAEIDQSNERRD